VVAIGVATAALIAITVTLGPPSPSQAVMLERIRSTAVLAAQWKTMHITASEVLRAPQGYVVSPSTNAFTFTQFLINPGGRGSSCYLPLRRVARLPAL
jgi:hypothetical protein